MVTDLRADLGPVADASTPLRRRRRRAVLPAVAVLALIAIGVAAGSRAGEPRDAGDRVAGEGVAPAFDLPRVGVDGERVRLEDVVGRPLVVNFWASWCVPCRKEMPALQAVAQRLEGRVRFVGINDQDGSTPAAEFEARAGATYPSGYDPDGAVAREFGVFGLPTTVLVDARGRIVARRVGEVTETELEALIADAFGVDSPRIVS